MEYKMIGILIQPFYPNILFESTDLRHDKKSNILNGRLYDYYGSSNIEGLLKEEEMAFVKQYDSSEEIIKYIFRKNNKGLWVGKFFQKGYMGGEAHCEIFGIDEKPKFDWNFILKNTELSIEGNENWAKDFTKSMIDEGYFKEIRDEETGESFLIPVDKE